MIITIQRVKNATVNPVSDPALQSSISHGLFVLVGVDQLDTEDDVKKAANKLSKIRLFSDQDGKMNLSASQAGAEILVVSQFTLISDPYSGNRPSFIKAARPEQALSLYELFCSLLTSQGQKVKTGFFGQYMEIKLILDGPVTINLDSRNL